MMTRISMVCCWSSSSVTTTTADSLKPSRRLPRSRLRQIRSVIRFWISSRTTRPENKNAKVPANTALLAIPATGGAGIKSSTYRKGYSITKTKPHIVEESEATLDPAVTHDPVTTPADPVPPISPEDAEQLDEEERQFRAMRRDIPGVKGASAAGVVSISVGKAPLKNEFFRTHRDPHFRPLVPMVDVEVGMEKHFFAVTSEMIAPLTGIGISVSDRVLYFTVTARGALRFIPVRQATGDS